jgi:hypothetical protein
VIVRLAARSPAAAPGTWSSPGNGPATDRKEHPVTTALRATAAPAVPADLPADESLPFELALVDALALAVDIRAAAAAASRVHELQPRG